MLRLTDAYLIDMWFVFASLKFITKKSSFEDFYLHQLLKSVNTCCHAVHTFASL